ncbi:polysaccharide pyruvyl transferase family protein [Brevundimonas diminuta]|uniref:polysaccharide pyruvyl transferase family protein n=1 Tax=Brevundimonas diminuta TaxID=293 RepID=UPI003F807EA7
MQMAVCDRDASAQLDLLKINSHYNSAKTAAKDINNNFDALFLTFANVLRPGVGEGTLVDVLEHIDVPIYAVGMGMQGEMPAGDTSSMHPNMLRLLRLLDERAKVFGVRGHFTLEWLQSIGIKNAIALGCPSMFAYPENVLTIKAPSGLGKIMVAGRVAPARSPESRTHQLVRGLENLSCSFVFQEELIHYHELMDIKGLYDEASQTLDADAVNKFLEEKCGFISPFNKYYSFGEAPAWRQAASSYDLYIGDRIHGGVAAMQVGVPALVLFKDQRVKELAAYHGIPHCTIDEFADIGALRCVRKYLNEDRVQSFHSRYASALRKFEKTMLSNGIKLHNRKPI